VAIPEKRASEQGASILAIHVIVGVNEGTALYRLAHSFAICNGVDETISQIIGSFGRPVQVGESLSVAIIRRRRRAQETEAEDADEFADKRSKTEQIGVLFGVRTKIPARLSAVFPRRMGGVVVASGVKPGRDRPGVKRQCRRNDSSAEADEKMSEAHCS